jgi:hypothetical protein
MMKIITKNTILKQGDKKYTAVQRVDGLICWVSDEKNISVGNYVDDGFKVRKWLDNRSLMGLKKVVAQSSSKLDGIPVIDLESHIDVNSYTKKDIERVIGLSRVLMYNYEIIIDQINRIQVIEVDEDFNIIDINSHENNR